MADLAAVWKEHQNAAFPASCLPLAIDGTKLVQIDAAAGAILTASLRTDGVPRPLDDARKKDLERHRELIRRVLREVPLDATGLAYFTRLERLASLVLSP